MTQRLQANYQSGKARREAEEDRSTHYSTTTHEWKDGGSQRDGKSTLCKYYKVRQEENGNKQENNYVMD